MDKKLIAIFVAVAMLSLTLPFVASEDSNALVEAHNMSLNSDRAVLYVASGEDHSFTFTASFTDGSSNTISWKLNDLDDGVNVVSFSDIDTVTTATGNSVTVYGKNVGSIEVEAYVEGNETTYCVSAVVLVRAAATATATEFNFWFQVYGADAKSYAEKGISAISENLDTWIEGFWVTVTQSQVLDTERDEPTTEFNAKTALEYIVETHSEWQVKFSNYGWIDTFMGLGTYASGSTYYYWAQYHLGSDGAWEFNNSTLEFIDTQDHAYLGLIFWGSPDASTMPPSPSLPVSEHLLE